MKPKDPNEESRNGFHSRELTYASIVGTVVSVKHYPPLPPGGTRLKYVRGKGLVVIGPRQTDQVHDDDVNKDNEGFKDS